jgi:hypothetical protein
MKRRTRKDRVTEAGNETVREKGEKEERRGTMAIAERKGNLLPRFVRL